MENPASEARGVFLLLFTWYNFGASNVARFFVLQQYEEFSVQFKISQFTPGAEATLTSRPNPISHRGTVSHAEVVLVIRLANAIISLSKTKAQLPQAEIHDQSIAQTVCGMIKKICGIEGGVDRQMLMGKFLRGHAQSPVYVVNYFPSRDERIALAQCSDAFCFEHEMLHSRPSLIVPSSLLALLVGCSHADSLGFDEEGRLVLWTPDVESRVLESLSTDQYEGAQLLAA